jgi:hypothetical protein
LKAVKTASDCLLASPPIEKVRSWVHITIFFSESHDVSCDRCGWLDGRGGVQLKDNTGASRVLCHRCTVELVRKCLPNGRFGSAETIAAAVSVEAA